MHLSRVFKEPLKAMINSERELFLYRSMNRPLDCCSRKIYAIVATDYNELTDQTSVQYDNNKACDILDVKYLFVIIVISSTKYSSFKVINIVKVYIRS